MRPDLIALSLILASCSAVIGNATVVFSIALDLWYPSIQVVTTLNVLVVMMIALGIMGLSVLRVLAEANSMKTVPESKIRGVQ